MVEISRFFDKAYESKSLANCGAPVDAIEGLSKNDAKAL